MSSSFGLQNAHFGRFRARLRSAKRRRPTMRATCRRSHSLLFRHDDRLVSRLSIQPVRRQREQLRHARAMRGFLPRLAVSGGRRPTRGTFDGHLHAGRRLRDVSEPLQLSPAAFRPQSCLLHEQRQANGRRSQIGQLVQFRIDLPRYAERRLRLLRLAFDRSTLPLQRGQRPLRAVRLLRLPRRLQQLRNEAGVSGGVSADSSKRWVDGLRQPNSHVRRFSLQRRGANERRQRRLREAMRSLSSVSARLMVQYARLLLPTRGDLVQRAQKHRPHVPHREARHILVLRCGDRSLLAVCVQRLVGDEQRPILRGYSNCLGCGGTTNRFTDRNACEQQCISKVGSCPRGMAAFLTPTGPQASDQAGQPPTERVV